MDKLGKNNLFFMSLLQINKLIKNLIFLEFNKINKLDKKYLIIKCLF